MSTDGPSEFAQSRAILIGTSVYSDAYFPSLPAVTTSLRGMRGVLTDPTLCGWPIERTLLWQDPADVPRLVRDLRRLARETRDVLLVYFAGHGTITRRGQLCMILADTEADDADITGLEFDRVREAVLDSPARTKIVILDCCYSGRAIEALGGADVVADSTDTRGVYTLTASDHTAHVVALDQQGGMATSFTGEFLDLVRSGVPGGPAYLTLSDLYLHLRHRLQARALPAPNQRGTDTADRYAFTRNAAIPTADPATATATRSQSSPSSVALHQPAVADEPPSPDRFSRAGDGPPPEPGRPDRPGLSHPLHAVGHVRRRTFLAAGVLVATAIVPSGDAFGGRYPFVGHTGEVHTVAFDVDGKLLASGGMDGTVRLWNTATGHLIKTFAVSDPVMSVAFAPRSRRFLVGAGGGSVKSLMTTQDVEGGTLTFIYRNPACEVGCAITSVAFSPDGRFLAGGGLDRLRKATIWLWQASTQNLAKTLTGHTRAVVSVAFSPDSKTLATGSDDDTIRLWNPTTGHSTSTFKHAGRPDALAFSPDGKTLASGGMDGIIRLWNVTTGHSTSLTGHSAYVTSVAFSPDGKTLATGSHDKSVRLWRLATGRTIKVLTGTGSVTSVAFSPDGKTLAGSYDKTIRLWKTDG